MEFCLFVSFLLVTPFFVFRLIITDKEKGETAYAEKHGSGAEARLALASLFVGMCGFFLLGVYASFGFALAMPRCAFSDAYLWGGLLVCMAVSVLVGIGPLVVARGKGYRVDVREWLCLAIVVSTPYVVVLCAFDWR